MAHKSPVEVGIYVHNSFLHGVSAEEIAVRQLGRRNFKTAPPSLQYAMECLGDSVKATSMQHAASRVSSVQHAVDHLGDSAKATWGGPSVDGR
eukprot:4200656-Amphidinium_carterae.1